MHSVDVIADPFYFFLIAFGDKALILLRDLREVFCERRGDYQISQLVYSRVVAFVNVSATIDA